MSLQIQVLAAAVLLYLLIKYLNQTDIPKIKGLPEIPGWPMFGSLIELGDAHAERCKEWARVYGPVFQVRMGNRRIVMANTYKSVRDLWITNQSALIDRPKFYTFHGVVSTSQGFTIGTSPWDESCKNRRKAMATALNRPAVASYMPIIDLESSTAIRYLLSDSIKAASSAAAGGGNADINPSTHFQRFALNTSLTLNYGVRIDKGMDDHLLEEIVSVEAAISRLRSTSNNWQDYVPILRTLPGGKDKEAKMFRERRDRYLAYMLGRLKKGIREGTDRPCITGNILKDPEARLNEEEIKSICLTSISAGIDTVPANLLQGIGYLSSPHGQEIQQKAYSEIQKTYPSNNAWTACLAEEKVEYITALVKEVLRYYTVISMCLPRKSTKDIFYKDASIPAGTLFYMNAYAADYDETYFQNPTTFDPERYLSKPSSPTTSPSTTPPPSATGGGGTPHFAYGAGSRMCAGSHLANRELYTAFLRLILAFRILPPENEEDAMVLDVTKAVKCKTALVAEPRDFKCRFEPRDRMALGKWLDESERRTGRL